jgi:hypothetical protein
MGRQEDPKGRTRRRGRPGVAPAVGWATAGEPGLQSQSQSQSQWQAVARRGASGGRTEQPPRAADRPARIADRPARPSAQRAPASGAAGRLGADLADGTCGLEPMEPMRRAGPKGPMPMEPRTALAGPWSGPTPWAKPRERQPMGTAGTSAARRAGLPAATQERSSSRPCRTARAGRELAEQSGWPSSPVQGATNP